MRDKRTHRGAPSTEIEDCRPKLRGHADRMRPWRRFDAVARPRCGEWSGCAVVARPFMAPIKLESRCGACCRPQASAQSTHETAVNGVIDAAQRHARCR